MLGEQGNDGQQVVWGNGLKLLCNPNHESIWKKHSTLSRGNWLMQILHWTIDRKLREYPKLARNFRY